MHNIKNIGYHKSKGCDILVTLQKIALVVTIIGAVNWGLIGLFDFNLVAMLFESVPIIEKIIYILVGITGLINIGILFMNFEERD